ncbi:MAG: hypothetical protein ACREBQ_07125, partial [Nitrososphaerales archaeon]
RLQRQINLQFFSIKWGKYVAGAWFNSSVPGPVGFWESPSTTDDRALCEQKPAKVWHTAPSFLGA